MNDTNGKIEVTQEMIWAGLAVLPYYPDGTFGRDMGDVISEVYRAMRGCAPEPLTACQAKHYE